jgi:hypothetical protein
MCHNSVEIKLRFSNYSRFELEIKQTNNDDASTSVQLLRNKFKNNLKSIYLVNLYAADYLVYNLANLIIDDAPNIFEFNLNNKTNSSLNDLNFFKTQIDIKNFLTNKLPHSLRVIERALDEYKNIEDELCISFNGGKDCCAVLYLTHAVLMKRNYNYNNNNNKSLSQKLNLLFIEVKDQFNEMEMFCEQTIQNFYAPPLTPHYIKLDKPDKSLKESLAIVKHQHPSLECILMGIRRTDNVYFKVILEIRFKQIEFHFLYI